MKTPYIVNDLNHSDLPGDAITGADIAVAAEKNEGGFSLVETTVSLVIILVGLLAVADAFTFSILYNAGNASRTQSLALMQQETEFLRSKKFSPATTDPELTGGVKAIKYLTTPNGGNFSVADVIDDDPSTAGIQTDPNTSIKEITVVVRLVSPSPGWQTAVPAKIVMRRARGN